MNQQNTIRALQAIRALGQKILKSEGDLDRCFHLLFLDGLQHGLVRFTAWIEDQERPENRNPEEQRQEEGPENQEDPDNQPQILLVIRRPAVTAPEAPVVERPAPEEQREVVGLEGQREAQPGEQPDPNVFFIPPERRVGDDGVPLPRNQDEPRQEDLEGQENRRPEEPRQ
ncbi:Protein CBG17789 [Caenorhabditis briggsae]|uniref:Protein CBG17789 n=1 Tax=Caenorhabditis briggsae TaxID=6238 RepID=A8XRT1_CAEBR|nr:Protein CBG17789 [Caenorhabditis briggsae]CAP35356.2 Protein CBG17789 [Caenorhabditis briggsae]